MEGGIEQETNRGREGGSKFMEEGEVGKGGIREGERGHGWKCCTISLYIK